MFQHPPNPIRLFPALLHRPPTAAQQSQARQLFRWGFLCLPVLWLLNWALYRHVLRDAAAPAGMKAHVRCSLVGACVAATAAVCWLLVFYHQQQQWGARLMPFDPLNNRITQDTYPS